MASKSCSVHCQCVNNESYAISWKLRHESSVKLGHEKDVKCEANFGKLHYKGTSLHLNLLLLGPVL